MVSTATAEPADSPSTNVSSAIGTGVDIRLPPQRIRPSVEVYFEKLLWSSRFVVLIAVLSSVIVAIAMFYVATVDTVLHLSKIGEYASASLPPEKHEELRTQTVAHTVEAIDGYLLATVMLIFSFGLYELFI